MSKIKKVIVYFLSGLVLLFCIIAILGIWDIIDLENLLSRMFQSMMVILAASAVIVFIFAIMLKDYRRDEDD
jgi:heme/copper-type cytochrome/quinol oxidase subunit 2